MLTLNLKPVFAARSIDKPYAFLKKNGFTHTIAKALATGKVVSVNISYMEKLCILLWCEPSDLFQWQPAEGTVVTENHPLLPLSHKWDAGTQLKNALSHLPYKKLNEVSTALIKEVEERKG
jgi:DNA-binding Xre family transcriptional regulator